MATSNIKLISNDNKIDKCDIYGGDHLTTSCKIFLKALNEHNKKANEVNAINNNQNNQTQHARFSDRNKVICYYCKKPGHYLKYCRKRIFMNNRAARDQASGNASGASTSGASHSALNTPNQ